MKAKIFVWFYILFLGLFLGNAMFTGIFDKNAILASVGMVGLIVICILSFVIISVELKQIK